MLRSFYFSLTCVFNNKFSYWTPTKNNKYVLNSHICNWINLLFSYLCLRLKELRSNKHIPVVSRKSLVCTASGLELFFLSGGYFLIRWNCFLRIIFFVQNSKSKNNQRINCLKGLLKKIWLVYISHFLSDNSYNHQI